MVNNGKSVNVSCTEKRAWLEGVCGKTILLGLTNDATNFFYRAMHDNEMGFYDADSYAWLNTLFGYDIGIENARNIIKWLYENDQNAFEFNAGNKGTLENICELELGLKLDFTMFAESTPIAARYNMPEKA